MKKWLAILCLFLAGIVASAQPPARVVPEKMTCKAGELYELSVSTKGDVKFDFDKLLRAKVNGKVLIFIGPSKSTAIRVATQDPFDLQTCLVEVESTPLPPDDATDSKLRREVAAGFARIDIAIAKLDSRLVAVEGKPAPPIPKPPVPTTVVKHLSFVGVTKPIDAGVVNDPGLRMWLKENGISAHVTGADFGPFAATVKIHGVPLIILQDAGGNIIDAEPLTTVTAAKALATKYLGTGMSERDATEFLFRAVDSMNTKAGLRLPTQTVEQRLAAWEAGYPTKP